MINNTMNTITITELETAIKDLMDEEYFGDGLSPNDKTHLGELVKLQKELPDNVKVLIKDSYLEAYITMVNYKLSGNNKVLSTTNFVSVNYGDTIYWYQAHTIR